MNIIIIYVRKYFYRYFYKQQKCIYIFKSSWNREEKKREYDAADYRIPTYFVNRNRFLNVTNYHSIVSHGNDNVVYIHRNEIITRQILVLYD